MANLLTILKRMTPNERFYTEVIEVLKKLSEGIEFCQAGQGSILRDNKNGLDGFVDGLQIALNEKDIETDSFPFNLGYSIGKQNKELEQGKELHSQPSASYTLAFEQLRKTALNLDRELDGMIEAYFEPYKYLKAEVSNNNMKFLDVTKILLGLLSSHRDLVEKLLSEKDEGGYVRLIKEDQMPSEYTQEFFLIRGLNHLFRGECYRAQYDFQQAGLNVFASKILVPYGIIEPALKKIEFARKFERNEI